MENQEEKFICQYCQKEFNTIQAKSTHQGQCHQNSKIQNQYFTCRFCNEFSTHSKSGLTFHENHCKKNPKYVKIHVVHPKTKCQYCGKEIDNSNLKKHEEACSNPNSKLNQKKEYVQDYNKDLTCKYCGKQYRDAGNLVQHEKNECLLNPNITQEQRDLRHQSYLDRYKNASDDAKEAMKWNKGHTKEDDPRLAEYGKTISQYFKDHPDKITGGFREGTAQRCKWGTFDNIYFDSSWELAFYIYCKDQNLNIQRNINFFNYTASDNKEHKYYPDFIIDDIYYEVKGSYSDDDYLKINQFPLTLNVINRNSINKYLNYTKGKYGENFTEVLYDKDKPSYLTQKDKINYKVI